MTIGSFWARLGSKIVRMGLLSPSWFGYRWIEKETVHEYLNRKQNPKLNQSYEVVHKEEVVQNPLPCNIEKRSDLPRDRGWWGYSFWDVPERTSGETYMAKLPDCSVIPCINPDDDEFWITILNEDERSLEMDQITLRPWNVEILRSAKSADKADKA